MRAGSSPPRRSWSRAAARRLPSTRASLRHRGGQPPAWTAVIVLAATACRHGLPAGALDEGAPADARVAADAATESSGPSPVSARADGRANGDAGADGDVRRSNMPPVEDDAPAGGEARRETATRLDDAWLRPAKAALADAFGPFVRGPFDVQRADLVGGGTVALITPSAGGPAVAVVVDGDRLVWAKSRPIGGMVAPIEHLTIAPRPDGGVALFVWVASLHTVAVRMWADDGNAFGDFEVFAPRACDALSVAYARGRGWWVLCTSNDGTRAQRLRDDGTVAWDASGVPMGATGPSGPATVVIDSPSSAVVLQRVAAIGGDRLLAFRYDLGGRPLWARPIELGVLRAETRRDERLEAPTADPAAPGRLRLMLPTGIRGRWARVVDIGRDGDVTPAR